MLAGPVLLLATALPSAAAADLGLGWSALRHSYQDENLLGAMVRTDRDGLLDGEVRLAAPLGSSADRLAIARSWTGSLAFVSGDPQQRTAFADRGLVEVLADVGPERTPGRTVMVPHVRAGVGVLAVERMELVSEQGDPADARSQGLEFRVPVVLDTSFELWSLYDAGVRFTVGGMAYRQAAYAPETGGTAADGVWVGRFRIGFELTYATGGR